MSHPENHHPPYQPPQRPLQGEQFQGHPQAGFPQYGQEPLTRTDSNAKLIAIIAHGSSILTSFIAPLIFWVLYKDKQDPESRYIGENARHAFNFSLTMFLAGIALGLATGILSVVTFGIASFTTMLVGAPGILVLVFAIIAMVKVGEGETYRYPDAITIRFVK